MTEMRPDADSDEAGAESEYGNDTGFAAQATRQPGTDGSVEPVGSTGDAEDDADDDADPARTTMANGPGDGAD